MAGDSEGGQRLTGQRKTSIARKRLLHPRARQQIGAFEMPVILDKYRLAYLPVPKVACTSVKTRMFEIENGVPFKAFRINGKAFHIHHYSNRGVPFESLSKRKIRDHVRIVVVRNPIERFLSGVSNRVVFHKDLAKPVFSSRLAGATLPVMPNLTKFVQHFEDYFRYVGSIEHHFAPMVTFLGKDPGYFEKFLVSANLMSFPTSFGS